MWDGTGHVADNGCCAQIGMLWFYRKPQWGIALGLDIYIYIYVKIQIRTKDLLKIFLQGLAYVVDIVLQTFTNHCKRDSYFH